MPRSPEGTTTEGTARAAAEGVALGLYRFTRYKTGGKDGSAEEPADNTGANMPELGRFDLVALSLEEADGEAMARGAEAGTKAAAATLLARDLAKRAGEYGDPGVPGG